MFKKKIAIIGGGPNSVYATEILLKKILKKKPKEKIKIFFFDKFGNFGFGNTHNIKLEKKILLNRIAHQISLGSNPFIKFPNKLKKFDYNFMEWVKINKIKNIYKESWPSRSMFGKSLKDKFYDLIDIFRMYTNVEIELIYGEVTSINIKNKKYFIITDKNKVQVDHVLIATGNYNSSIHMNMLSRHITKISKNTNCIFYYDFINHLPDKKFWEKFAGKKIIIYGTGVTSIDIITMINKKDNEIFSISRSSLFPFARPFNQKIDDPEKKEHKPIFLKNELIKYLKININNKNLFGQIDFEKFIHPLIKIEFYYVYFKHFVKIKELSSLRSLINSEIIKIKLSNNFDFRNTVNLFDTFLMDQLISNKISKKFYLNNWFSKKNSLSLISNNQINFYDLFINPMIKIKAQNFTEEYLKFLDWDINQAKLGNIGSPYKNACDGVWRDIRQQFTNLFDNCNNLPIYDYFLKNILSIHNKLCDGPSVDSILQIRKLIKNKKIIILTKNNYEINKNNKNLFIKIKNKKTKIDYIFYGIADLYKRNYLNDKLITNMIKNNLVSLNEMKFNNKSFILGLNLNKDQNPIIKNRVHKKIRFVGPTSEGRKFFHHTLSRPDKKQFNMTDLIDWSNKII